MAITAVELQARPMRPRSRHLRVVRRSPRPGGAIAARAGGMTTASPVFPATRAASGRREVAPTPGGLPGLARVPRGVRRAGASAIAAVVLVLGGWLGVAAAPPPHIGGVPPGGGIERTVMVAQGESVWDVAAAQAPDAVGAYAAAVLALNGLTSAAVPSGTVLQLPEG